jgi:MFS family permease
VTDPEAHADVPVSPGTPPRYPLAALATLLLTTLMLGVSIGLSVPLIAGRLDARGVGPLTNGLTSTVMYLAIGIGALVAGRWIRRQGARSIFLAGAGGLAATLALFPLFPSLGAWFALRAATGFFAALFFVSTEVAVGLVGDPNRRGRNLAFYGVAFSLGFSGGAASWPFVAPLSDGVAFGIAAGASLAALILGPYLFPAVRPAPKHRLERRRQPRERLAGALACGFSYGFCEGIVVALMPVYAVRVGYSESSAGVFFVLIVGSSLVAHVPVGLAADRIGAVRLVRTFAFVSLAAVILPLIHLHAATLAAACIGAGVGVGALYTLGLADIGRRVDDEGLAAANARFTAAYGIGSVLGPAAAGLAMITIGPQGFFVSLAACLAFLAAVAAFAMPPPPAPRATRVTLRWAREVDWAIEEWT